VFGQKASVRFIVAAMPRVTEDYKAARRLEILSAACRCFAKDGFHATSISDIIDESGLSAGAVYLYFESKDEIIAAVVEMTLSTADELFSELRADEASLSPEATVAFMVGAMMDRTVDHPKFGVDMTRVVLHAWAEALRNPAIATRIADSQLHVRRHYAEVVRGWQAAGRLDPAANSEDVAAVVQGIVHVFALQRLLIPGTDITRYLSAVRALLATEAQAAAPGHGHVGSTSRGRR
jgi:AcrR family transcriptional regulator